jgi:hypothetical protein
MFEAWKDRISSHTNRTVQVGPIERNVLAGVEEHVELSYHNTNRFVYGLILGSSKPPRKITILSRPFM